MERQVLGWVCHLTCQHLLEVFTLFIYLCVYVCVFRSAIIKFCWHILRNLLFKFIHIYTSPTTHSIASHTAPLPHLSRARFRLFSRSYTDRLTWNGPCLILFSYLYMWDSSKHCLKLKIFSVRWCKACMLFLPAQCCEFCRKSTCRKNHLPIEVSKWYW